jgi:hypothetical protein
MLAHQINGEQLKRLLLKKHEIFSYNFNVMEIVEICASG